MHRTIWILLAVVAAFALGTVAASARKCSAYNLTASSAATATATVMPSATPETETSVPVAEYHKITAQEAKERMDSGDPVIIVDVRTQSEYDGGHIPGATLVPNEEIGTEMPDALPDKDAEILIYCRSGRRSKEAAQKLVAMGYTSVYDFGGIIDWPYETEQ